jgi:hypothetical protein
MSLVPKLKHNSVKKHYRIVIEFDLDCPDESYKLVTHERKGLSHDLMAYPLSRQHLTIYSQDHHRIGRFRRKPINIKSTFESPDEYWDDYNI